MIPNISASGGASLRLQQWLIFPALLHQTLAFQVQAMMSFHPHQSGTILSSTVVRPTYEVTSLRCMFKGGDCFDNHENYARIAVDVSKDTRRICRGIPRNAPRGRDEDGSIVARKSSKPLDPIIGESPLPREAGQLSKRRDVLSTIMISLTTSGAVACAKAPPASAALPFIGGKERRQLELCLVTLIRAKLWSESIANDIGRMLNENTTPGSMTDQMKRPYLEARLGAKALITGKVGGGATLRVYDLASFKLKECLRDGMAWHVDDGKNLRSDERKKRSRRDLEEASEAIIESLGAVVEFDGLETTQDPSPRSSLMLTMYNNDKANFVRRMLLEKTIPACDAFLDCFGTEVRESCMDFVRRNYPSELAMPAATAASDA